MSNPKTIPPQRLPACWMLEWPDGETTFTTLNPEGTNYAIITPLYKQSPAEKTSQVDFGFASFSDGRFELIVRDRKTWEETTLVGQLQAGQFEIADRILPTCLYVTATPRSGPGTAQMPTTDEAAQSRDSTPPDLDCGTITRNLRGLASRMQYRVEAIEARDGKGADAITGNGIGIGYLLAKDLADALSEAAIYVESHSHHATPTEKEVQDTWLVGGPDLKAMSGSIESDRIIQLHFKRRVNDKDREWLLAAINEKIASEREPSSQPERATRDELFDAYREYLAKHYGSEDMMRTSPTGVFATAILEKFNITRKP